MIIGGNEYSEIIVKTKDDELIASITDENMIFEDDCKIVCIPKNT